MRTPIIVLDACVALKPFLTEENAQKAERILYAKDQCQISVLVPEIFRYEFLNTLGRRVGSEAALIAYQSLALKQLSWIPTDDEISKIALKIMDKYPKVALYDAVYHALAIVNKVNLITSDKEYYEKVKAEGNIQLLDDCKF